jgi:ABC-type Mn2+/Zn2+ transport system permease subunit
MMVLAFLLTAAFNLLGLFLAVLTDLPPGAVIILVTALSYGGAMLVDRYRRGQLYT